MEREVFLVSADELFMFRPGQLNVTEIQVDKAQIIVRPQTLRVDVECLVKSLYCLGVAAYVEVNKPQVVAQFRILRGQQDRFGIHLQGIDKLAQLVVGSAKMLICSYKVGAYFDRGLISFDCFTQLTDLVVRKPQLYARLWR